MVAKACPPSSLQGLEPLIDKVMTGDAVFFIGAGFSLDSEGNSTGILMRRLLIRFIALAEVLKSSSELANSDAPARATTLAAALTATFYLKVRGRAIHHLLSKNNIERLSERYYASNDWMCNAFGLLLAAVATADVSGEAALYASLERCILDKERELRLRGLELKLSGDPHGPGDHLDLADLMQLDPECRGKAMFLDAMGFASEQVMCGRPSTPDILDVQASYSDRLRDRHRVLAWLAREGLTPTLVTTNYDLLLEGAYRLAGMMPENAAVWRASDAARPTSGGSGG